MIQLNNDHLAISINEKGAELQSVQLNKLEYLWQADPDYWSKHSPVLFPIVGELKDGKYTFDNKEYHLSRHGFARDKIFEPNKLLPLQQFSRYIAMQQHWLFILFNLFSRSNMK